MFAFGRNEGKGCRKRGGCSSSCLAFKANRYWHVQLSLLCKNTGSKAYGKRVPDFVVDDGEWLWGHGPKSHPFTRGKHSATPEGNPHQRQAFCHTRG